MRERISCLFPLLFPIGQVKQRRRGAAQRGRGCGDRALIVLPPRGQRGSPGSQGTARGSCLRPGSLPGRELGWPAPVRIAFPSLSQSSRLFRLCPKRRFFPQTESNPSLGCGPVRAGVDDVFVGRRDAGERGSVVGKAPVPAALLAWPCCLAWPCRLASPCPQHRLRARQAASHQSIRAASHLPPEHPHPTGGCSRCSFAASCPRVCYF